MKARSTLCLLLILFTCSVPAADDMAAGLKVEILEIKRTPGDTVTLRFKVANPTASAVELTKAFGDYDVSSVRLVDWVSKKRLGVVQSPNPGFNPICVCSRSVGSDWSIAAGTMRQLWAKFPAPPASVGKLSVEIPGAIPIEDVPVK